MEYMFKLKETPTLQTFLSKHFFITKFLNINEELIKYVQTYTIDYYMQITTKITVKT